MIWGDFNETQPTRPIFHINCGHDFDNDLRGGLPRAMGEMVMIDWSKQHCGVHRASFSDLCILMPDLNPVLASFPKSPKNFTWDVKVHMLMPAQYPCIPNWHYDNVPRINNEQDFEKVQLDKPMYLWVSGPPLTEFKSEITGEIHPIRPKTWFEFNQKDLHRGTVSHDFQWRGFIRATHIDIQQPIKNPLRRHSQVYLDAASFRW